MKRLFLLLAVASLFLIVPKSASAQNTQDFSFKSFNADYYLNRDDQNTSTLTVKESLVAEFPDVDQNHGILRAIPETYKGHSLNFKLLYLVDQNNAPYLYSSSDQNGNKVLKIGDPSSYVHGEKIYNLEYQIQDVASFFKDHDEFFWDINGDQWQQNFESVEAKIHIPSSLAQQSLGKQICYTGAFGSTAQNCSISVVQNDGEELVSAKASNVGPTQTLSVVLGFKPGTFELSPAAKKDQQKHLAEHILAVVLAVGIPAVLFIVMFRRWQKFGNDPKGRGIIIPEYEPPEGFDVLSSDFMLKEKLRSQAFSAMLIDLAVRGYLIIYEVPKKGVFGKTDYELEVKKSSADLSVEVKRGLDAIFGDSSVVGSHIKLSDFKKTTTVPTEIKKMEKDLSLRLYSLGYFVRDPRKTNRKYHFIGLFLVVVAALILQDAVRFKSKNPMLIGLLIGAGLGGLVILLFARIMPARTEKGVAVYEALLGLKDYIKLAEADRLNYLQSPAGAEKIQNKEAFDPKDPVLKVKLFEKLLPYAILFGQEKNWAKQFEGIYKNPPDWYQGGNWAAFNTGYLVGSLDNFNSASMQSFVSPSSSSGSGFSGGGAGGGGGGGGGGGW